MRTLIVLLAVSAVALLPSSLRAQETEQTLYVSVLDKEGHPVSGLDVPDFRVKEDGQSREILRAGRTADPLDLGILIDNSQSIQPYLNDFRKALTTFVTKMADEQSASISLIGMADRPTGLEDYTTSVATLQRGVQKVFPQPGAGTVFQDSIVDAIKGIRARKNPRRALLVITADGPDFSNVPYQRTLEVLAASGTTLHVLRISPNGGSMRDEPARDRSYVIDQGTRASGGRRQELLTSMGLADALSQVAEDLGAQYKVVYGRPGALIPPKAVEVGVTREDLTARGTLAR